MPLVILSGFPASGKTKRANELMKYLQDNFPNRKVHNISDHTCEVERNGVYAGRKKWSSKIPRLR